MTEHQALPVAHDPVFRSVGQALFVAYLLEVLPPTTKGATQIVIEDLRRRHFMLPENLQKDRTLNASGLSPLELRGQCAMVRSAVQNHLPKCERDVVWARYGHQRTKAQGVSGLAEYMGGLSRLTSTEARLAVCWAIYTPKTLPRDRETGRTKEWSLRDISKTYDIARSTLADAQRIIRHHAEQLEKSADIRLAELFDRTGLVGEIEEEYTV